MKNLNRASCTTVLNINTFHLKGRIMLCWFSLWVDFTSRLREEGWLNTWTSAPNFIHARSPKSASYHKPTGNCTHYLKITTQAKYLLLCLYWKNAKRRPTCTHRPQLFKIIFGPTLKSFRLLSQLNDLTRLPRMCCPQSQSHNWSLFCNVLHLWNLATQPTTVSSGTVRTWCSRICSQWVLSNLTQMKYNC